MLVPRPVRLKLLDADEDVIGIVGIVDIVFSSRGGGR
jgi:hypothetical protein